MIEKMIQKINETIELSKKWYETTGIIDVTGNHKIYGMIEMLQIATGKEYYFDNEGLHERV